MSSGDRRRAEIDAQRSFIDPIAVSGVAVGPWDAEQRETVRWSPLAGDPRNFARLPVRPALDNTFRIHVQGGAIREDCLFLKTHCILVIFVAAPSILVVCNAKCRRLAVRARP